MLPYWMQALMNKAIPDRGRGARTLPRRTSFRPQLEALEDRLTPALVVTDSLTPNQLVSTILGQGLQVSNISYQGNNVSSGRFTGGAGAIGFDSGIILSTGQAKDVVGVASDFASTSNGLPGDAQLSAQAGNQTFDATVLEFDFIPTGNLITFNYVFASEEYPEFVNSAFNDAFAFFINGSNVALLPGTSTTVSINNVNQFRNTQFFIDNSNGPLQTSMDGLTVVLCVQAQVTPGQTNHIKMAIADTGDSAFDSNVFIQAGSFQTLQRQFIAAGAGTGAPPEVRVFDAHTHDLVNDFYFFAYSSSFTGGVRTAVGDVNGDGTPDIITAAGPGGGPHVKVFSGTDQALLYSFFAFDPSFTRGVNVAVGDVNADGKADIIVGADAGGGPNVKVFSGANGGLLRSFYAFDPRFQGGVNVAGVDVNGDGAADIVVGAGPGGGPHVKVFSGADNTVLRSFFAYDPSFGGGVTVTAGLISDQATGCAMLSIITAPASGTTPHIKVFDALMGDEIRSFLAPVFLFFDDGGNNGTRVAAGDVNGGFSELLIAYASPGARTVIALDINTLQVVDTFIAFDRLLPNGLNLGANG
jgi:hypothetical protein